MVILLGGYVKFKGDVNVVLVGGIGGVCDIMFGVLLWVWLVMVVVGLVFNFILMVIVFIGIVFVVGVLVKLLILKIILILLEIYV